MDVEKLAKTTKEGSAVWLEYVQQRKQESDSPKLFCFYEGEDGKYYRPRIIKCFKNTDLIPFICGGRKNVLKVYDKLVETNEDFSALLFFVDRDFSPVSSRQYANIYQTPVNIHSLENFYTNAEVVEHILNDRMQLRPKEVKEFLELYNKLHNDFIKSYKKISLWYMACVSLGFPLNFDNYKPIAHIKIDNKQLVFKQPEFWKPDCIGKCAKRGMESSLAAKYEQEYHQILKAAYNFEIQYRAGINVRGKFDFEFLKIFIAYIDHLNKTGKLSKQYKMVQVAHLFDDVSDPLSNLSEYASTPICLNQYINNHSPI